MQSRRHSIGRQRLALVALTSLWLSACGGGGGGSGGTVAAAPASSASGTVASAPAPAPSSGASATASGPAPAPVAAAPAPAAAPAAPAAPAGPTPNVVGTDGPDTLQPSVHPAVMAGGKGDDIYYVTDPADVVIEQADGGIDEIRTTVGYTLPDNVENMSVPSAGLPVNGPRALVGNALNNHIVAPALDTVEVYGLDGDDILDASGRYGGVLDGGAGNDTLINNVGSSRGGPGADLFVVAPKRAMTAPDVPLTIVDFTPAEGDRIDGSFVAGSDPAALFASGNLVFDAPKQRLVYTLNPGDITNATSVRQVILLPGVTSFDPAWIVRR